MQQVLDIFLHLQDHLGSIIKDYGPWVYALLFAIIFAETGLVVTPFLPGDSLLFAAGAFTSTDAGEATRLSLWLLLGLLIVAAVLGDAVNYHVGRWVGPRLFKGQGVGFWGKLLSRKHLDRAHAFYERYGGKAVVLARFVPIVRTFVPFVAGAGVMNYSRFALYNVFGAVLWVGICVLAGHWFGNIEFVKKNFSIVVLGIIAVSLIPIAIEVWMHRRAKAAGATAPAPSAPNPTTTP
ncbi:MAG: DedA family protein [Phycisphaeraceae bacterium]|nr:DedA family protein [Phycisphaeraceae bacterium]